MKAYRCIKTYDPDSNCPIDWGEIWIEDGFALERNYIVLRRLKESVFPATSGIFAITESTLNEYFEEICLYKIVYKDNEQYVTEEEAEKLVKEYRENLGIFSVDETWRNHEEIYLAGLINIIAEPPREELLRFTKELNIPVTVHR